MEFGDRESEGEDLYVGEIAMKQQEKIGSSHQQYNLQVPPPHPRPLKEAFNRF